MDKEKQEKDKEDKQDTEEKEEIPKLQRQPTNTYDGSPIKYEKKNIVTLFVLLHGIELKGLNIKDELFNDTFKKEDVRIFSYAGHPGNINRCNSYMSSKNGKNMLIEINNKLRDVNNKESSYSIIHEKMQSQRETIKQDNIDIDINDTKVVKFKKSIDEEKNIRTYNPIIDKEYGLNLDDYYDDSLGIFIEGSEFIKGLEFIKGSEFIEGSENNIINIISLDFVINFILKKEELSLSPEIKKTFTQLLIITILTNIINSKFNGPFELEDDEVKDEGNTVYVDVKDIIKLIIENKDLKNINFDYDYKKNKSGDKLNILKIVINKKKYILNKGSQTHKLMDINLSDIIKLCSELGVNVLNIIDASCRVVKHARTYEDVDEASIQKLQEEEFDETNINRNRGGKTIKQKHLYKTKNRKTKNRKKRMTKRIKNKN